MTMMLSDLISTQSSDARISLSNYLTDPTRGILLPDQIGGPWRADPFVGEMPWSGHDTFGRPQRLNLSTITTYYHSDILGIDRLFLPESNRKMELFAHQRIIMQACSSHDFTWLQMMRGGAKTYTIARWALDYALQNPNTPIVFTGPSFRQALLAYDEVLRMIELNTKNERVPVRIEYELRGDPKRNQTESIVFFQNGSSIRALPMGDGSKIRGIRGGVLFIDEMYQMPEEMYSSHIFPFLQVMQSELGSKVVHATTSWYQDCFAYRRLLQFAGEINKGNPDYCILDFNLADLSQVERGRKFPLSPKIVRDAMRHSDPVTAAMTYFNVWPASSSRWFSQDTIDQAQSHIHGVHIEMKRAANDTKARYYGVLDLAASDKGDSTEFTVHKYENAKSKLVWAYQKQGLKPNERALLAHQVHDKFNLEFLIYDRHAAIGLDFKTTMEEKTLVVNGTPYVVQPWVEHDNFNKIGAKRMLIPVAVLDKVVRKAFMGPQGGEGIVGEGGLRELLFTKARELLMNGEIVGASDPKSLVDENGFLMEYSNSEQEVFDTIFEAFQQLGNIGIKRDKNGDIDYTDGGAVKFETRPGQHDDGAMCIVYSVIGHLKMSGKTGAPTPGSVVHRSMSPDPNAGITSVWGNNIHHQVLRI